MYQFDIYVELSTNKNKIQIFDLSIIHSKKEYTSKYGPRYCVNNLIHDSLFLQYST